MQVALFLLLFGSLQRVFGRNQAEASESLRLSYEDLEALAPEFAASSWRGIMNKLVQRGWVLKTLLGQKTVFVITKLGERKAATLLPVISGTTEAYLEVTLLLVRSVSGARPSAGRLQTHLKSTSFMMLMPGVYWLSGRWYEEHLLLQLEDAGYLATVATLSQASFHPLSLESFDQQADTHVMLLRRLEEVGRDSFELLNSLLEAKNLNQQHIRRLGRLTVSGLTFLAETGNQLSSFSLARKKVVVFLQTLDACAREYARKGMRG